MRSRWFHRPVMHAPAHDEGKSVSWLELFYDLVFVAGIIQLGDFLSADVSLAGFLKFSLHFIPLWIAWSGFTFYANRFNVDDFTHRALVLGQMFAVGAMAISSRSAMDGDPWAFSISYAVAQGLVSLLYLRAWMQVEAARDYCRYWGGVFAIGALLFAVAAWLPTAGMYVLWGLGVTVILSAPLSRQSRELTERFPIDQEHLSERYGLLTIIVLGESFVKVLSYLTAKEALDGELLSKGFFNLTLTCCIWWIYFDDVAGAHLKKERGAWLVWWGGHLPLTLSITAVGVAIKKAISFEVTAVAPESYRWLLAGTLALTLASVAMIDAVTERRTSELSDRNRVFVRAASAFVVLLLGQVGGSMSAGLFLGLISTICVAQVFIDLMMAPLEETSALAHAVSSSDLARQRMQGEKGPKPPRSRPNLNSTVRKGAPAALRRDLYFFFIEGSWTRLLLSFGFLYIFLNVVFAGLYQLEPGSIKGDTDQGFTDAFFFSVQTLASLGYGAIAPATPWADILVTVEAATGMLFVAMGTGLIFAKASLPQASVLFSKRMVLTQRNGVSTLMLRVANARGNEVADASVTVSVLLDEISPEGHHLRRLYPLKLVRDRSPMFTLTWLVMHEITEESPLHGVDWDDVLTVVVTFMGHDGTYGSTTYARRMYQPEDLFRAHRFVDVLSQLPDGRLMVDLGRFHDTLPEAEEDEASEPGASA